MNACTQSCDPSSDMEEVWRRSLIRVTDEFTLPPVVLRVDDAMDRRAEHPHPDGPSSQ